jgi:CRP-like cAMP-binding protein
MATKNEEPICEKCIVRAKSAFKPLFHEEYEKLYMSKSCKKFKKGEFIFQENHRLQGVYCIYKGKVKLFKTGPEGKDQIIRFAKPGDLLAFRAILSNEPACITAQALEDATLCFIPASTFLELAKENSKFSIRLLQISCNELKESNKFIIDLAQRPVKERLAQTLLSLQETFGTDKDGYIDLQLTREEIANIVGTATESIIRILSDFKKNNLIELSGKKIKIIDPKKLDSLIKN